MCYIGTYDARKNKIYQRDGHTYVSIKVIVAAQGCQECSKNCKGRLKLTETYLLSNRTHTYPPRYRNMPLNIPGKIHPTLVSGSLQAGARKEKRAYFDIRSR